MLDAKRKTRESFFLELPRALSEMKPQVAVLVLTACCACARRPADDAQLEGSWEATLIYGQVKSSLVLIIEPRTSGVYRGTLTDLDDGSGQVIKSISRDGDRVHLDITAAGRFSRAATVQAINWRARGARRVLLYPWSSMRPARVRALGGYPTITAGKNT